MCEIEEAAKVLLLRQKLSMIQGLETDFHEGG
mgnify:CR=1 FL=1